MAQDNPGLEIRVGAVILAAGFSSRMKAFKPLMPLADERVIDRVIKTVISSGIKDIVVVTGHNRNVMRPVIVEADLFAAQRGASVNEAYNPDFAQGMFTSIRTGICAMEEGFRELGENGIEVRRPDIDGVFIFPVDCPAVSPETVRMLISHVDDMKFAVPLYHGKKGHPLWIPRRFFYEIQRHGGEGGLKGITEKYPFDMEKIETGSEGVVLDMDDESGYEKVKRYIDAGCISESIRNLAADRRFIFIRHGQIVQHDEAIFLGQKDEPLSETGKKQAHKAGAELADMSPDTDVIYTSDLSRAEESAEIIAGELAEKGMNMRVSAEKGLREMSLGKWDGMFISSVKEQYPKEYDMRGKDILSFKTGNDSENFYDLQYRTVGALTDILKKDSSGDIIIVAHDGVIRCLYSNLKGSDVTDKWEKLGNGQILTVNV